MYPKGIGLLTTEYKAEMLIDGMYYYGRGPFSPQRGPPLSTKP